MGAITQPRASTAVLSEQFERLTANWPIDESRVKVMNRELKSVLERVGESRFKAAVTRVIQESRLQFFPSIGEFLGYVPETAKIIYCGEAGCIDGFRMVPDYEARRLYGNDTAMAARKCGCARLG